MTASTEDADSNDLRCCDDWCYVCDVCHGKHADDYYCELCDDYH
jgi:hypothetical protein